MNHNMKDDFEPLHPHDDAGERPAMSDLLEDHTVVAHHDSPGGNTKAEYEEEESIDTEPLPHSPNQNRPQTNTVNLRPQTTVQSDSYPAMVHGSPIGHKENSAADYNVAHHHHIQQLPYGNTNTMPGMQVPMMWGASEHGVLHPGDKPKRPLSAYNFFFQLERERIIKGDSDDKDKDGTYTVEEVARIALIQQRKAKENKPKPKRSHRKTHGKISFGDLARTIANKWKKLDGKYKSIFEGSASLEKERYKKELAEWTKKQKKWKDATMRMTLQNAGGGAYLMQEAAYGIVTPTQLPKKTVASTEVAGNSPRQSSVASMANSSSGRSTVPADSQQYWGNQQQQQQQQHTFSSSMDYQQDMCNFNENDYMHENSEGNHYDYDDVTNETYNMAQMTLPQPRPNIYQQRMMMHQRRMRMMMQQRQRMAAGMHNQAMMRMMRQSGASSQSYNTDDFDHQSFASESNYTGQQQEHSADGHDDGSTFMDPHSQGFMMNLGESHDMSPSQQTDGQMNHQHDDFHPLLHHGNASTGDDDFQPHPLNQADSAADEFTPIML